MYVVSASVQRGDKRDAAVRVWDLATGVVVAAYRGGVVARRGLAMCPTGLMLAAHRGKPAVHAWQLHSEPLHLRIPLVERASSLALLADGSICVLGTPSGRLCTWDVPSGDLLSVIAAAHYRAVTTLSFTDDGGHLVSGSDDGTVKVWKVRELVDVEEGSTGRVAVSPCHTWAEHTLPVTDVHCGYGGLGARVVTASKDCACKLWDLASGDLVGSLSLPADIHAVTMDPSEQYLYAGGGNGTVYAVALFRLLDLTPAASTLLRTKDLLSFVGHTKPVTMVQVSVDGTILASGSDDGDVRLWDTESRQCLKVLGHKDPLTALQLVPRHWIDHAADRTTSPIALFSRQPCPPGMLDLRRAFPVRPGDGAPADRGPAAVDAVPSSAIGDAGLVRDERDRLAAEVELWQSAAASLYEHTQRTSGL
mmetsp:Transcript_30819/g.92424  ORF Transcript_30819/g.92424 Transcript_30819/m.92424 type:complete len:421 (-) Transcript_30819:7-1269(-)